MGPNMAQGAQNCSCGPEIIKIIISQNFWNSVFFGTPCSAIASLRLVMCYHDIDYLYYFRGILVILVMLQVWLEKNWKQWSVCFGCIFDMGLHWLKWEKKWASLKKISTLIFGKMFDFFVPRRSWQFPVKSDAKASISFARPWNSP